MQANGKSLKTVFTTTFMYEIHLAKAKLENKGIRSFVVDENLNSIIGTAFIEGYKLNVEMLMILRKHIQY